MKRLTLRIVFILASVISCESFYKPVKFHNIKTVTPCSITELKTALCNKKGGKCDDTPLRIIINKPFKFTDSEGSKTETGCFHSTHPKECTVKGQLKLNIANQCNGLQATQVTYSSAGRTGIEVGSNKIIEARKGGAIIGKGLVLSNVQNVEIKHLRITDINAQVIWGGDAIDIKNSKNILIDGCYIKNIGRQMIVTHFGSNTGILVKNTVFDGRTPYSSYCNGYHYWLWLFLGTADQIAMQNNVIFNTNGRGPHLVAQQNSKTLLHLIQNIFYDIGDPGLIEQDDPNSSILAEGNIFYNVKQVVHLCKGHIFFPQSAADAKQCQTPLGRDCLINTVVKSGSATPINDPLVLQDFKIIKNTMTPPINMTNSINTRVKIPDVVKKLIK